VSDTIEREQSSAIAAPRKAQGRARPSGRDGWWQALTNGGLFGTSGEARRTFLYGSLMFAVLAGAINTVNVITIYHEEPQLGALRPIIMEGSSWLSFLFFTWLPWLAWRMAPLAPRPGWRALFLHPIGAVLFSACHVGGFVAMRKLVYPLARRSYGYGPLGPQFLYELRKDVFAYVLLLAGFWLAERLVTPAAWRETNDRTYDIRDGAKLTRVRLDDVLAIASAGNYVEFVLSDGRRILMRSPLGALETELGNRGFVRTHRSWVVNRRAVRGLKPEGSGDYTVEVGDLNVPLSRRFPQALADLRSSP
jgi:hypothetical protein